MTRQRDPPAAGAASGKHTVTGTPYPVLTVFVNDPLPVIRRVHRTRRLMSGDEQEHEPERQLDDRFKSIMDYDEQFQLAVQRINEGRWEEARDLLCAVVLEREEPVVFAKLGYVHWNLEEHDEAVNCFEQAVQLAPESELVSLGLFHSLWESGDQVAALDEMKRFMKENDSEDYRAILQELSAS